MGIVWQRFDSSPDRAGTLTAGCQLLAIRWIRVSRYRRSGRNVFELNPDALMSPIRLFDSLSFADAERSS
jgi:hypothetical protein